MKTKVLCLLSCWFVMCELNYAQNVFPQPSGNVGIGTASPDEKLVVTGDGASVKINAASNPSSYYTKIVTNWDWSRPTQLFSNGTEVLRTVYQNPMSLSLMPGGGNVGIGTVTPVSQLEISEEAPVLTITPSIYAGNYRTTLGARTGAGGFLILGNNGLNEIRAGRTGRGGYLDFYTDNTADQSTDSDGRFVMRLSSNGNLGLGTVNPAVKLVVADGGARGIELNPNSAGSAMIGAYDRMTAAYFPMRLLAAQFSFELGNVGIGTSTPTEKLSVNGKIRAQEVIVETTGWSDHVFADDYNLWPLAEVEQHIKQQKHLPGVPSARDVAENGVSVGEMQAILLTKIEELTLHQIAQEKEIQVLREQNAKLQDRLDRAEVK